MRMVALDAEDINALNAFLIRGLNYRQVYEETGITRARLRALLERADVKKIIDDMKGDLKQELDNLSGEAIQVIRDGFRNPDINVRLIAFEKYAKATGLYTQNINLTGVSAEDIARKLAAGDQLEESVVEGLVLPLSGPEGTSQVSSVEGDGYE